MARASKPDGGVQPTPPSRTRHTHWHLRPTAKEWYIALALLTVMVLAKIYIG